VITRERWKKVERAFDDAVEQPADVRRRTMAGIDDTLRGEVESMLTASADEKDVVGAIVTRAIGRLRRPTVPMVGRQIGVYRLDRELGHGGMGAVYLATRADEQFTSRVAIKLLHRGLQTEQAISRFRDERQILAALEHPNIVRLLDGGSTAEHLPYLVMEYVRGTPITAYARARGLAVRERVALFRQVCSAIHYAHGKLIVHRDLKPSNILVTEDGAVKLLDFGIAKLLDATGRREAHTVAGMMPLTPDYASPEQVRGEQITTATDVYSLGVVLYELICDALPHKLDGVSLPSVLEHLERVPARPSAAAPPERRRELEGDLDNIVLKAMDKDPARRYLSADRLAEDLRRYLDGLPVEARAATWSYRARKFARRNRLAVAAATLVLTSLAAATAVSIREAHVADAEARRAEAQTARAEEATQHAQRRFGEVRALANTLLFDVDEAIVDLSGSTAAREMIVKRAQQYLDRLVGEAADDPSLARELAIAYLKIGDILGDPYKPNLGKPEAAAASYVRAEAIIDRLLASQPEGNASELKARVTMARGVLAGDAALIERSVEIARDLPPTVDVLRTRALAFLGIAKFKDGANPAREARELSATTAAWMRLAPSPEARYFEAVAHELAAEAALMMADTRGAKHEREAALRILRELMAEFPKRASYRREVWACSVNLAEGVLGNVDPDNNWLPTTDEREDALRSLLEADREGALMSERDPADIRTLNDRANVWMALGVLTNDVELVERARATWLNVGEPDAARASCALAPMLAKSHPARARRAIDDARREIPHVPNMLAGEQCDLQIARAQHALGDNAASASTRDALERALRARVAAQPANVSARIGLVETLLFAADLRPDARCEYFDRAIETWAGWPGEATEFTRSRVAALETDRTSHHCTAERPK
jgi:hypothetical protein